MFDFLSNKKIKCRKNFSHHFFSTLTIIQLIPISDTRIMNLYELKLILKWRRSQMTETINKRTESEKRHYNFLPGNVYYLKFFGKLLVNFLFS